MAALCLLGRLDTKEFKVEGLNDPPTGQAVHLVVQVGRSAMFIFWGVSHVISKTGGVQEGFSCIRRQPCSIDYLSFF